MKIASLFFLGKIVSIRFHDRPSRPPAARTRVSLWRAEGARARQIQAINCGGCGPIRPFIYLQIHLGIQATPEARKMRSLERREVGLDFERGARTPCLDLRPSAWKDRRQFVRRAKTIFLLLLFLRYDAQGKRPKILTVPSLVKSGFTLGHTVWFVKFVGSATSICSDVRTKIPRGRERDSIIEMSLDRK